MQGAFQEPCEELVGSLLIGFYNVFFIKLLEGSSQGDYEAFRGFFTRLLPGFYAGLIRDSLHWGLNPGPSVYKTEALPLSYRGSVIAMRF
jgi:hypothetical protein